MRRRARSFSSSATFAALLAGAVAACGPGLGAGSKWVEQPLTDDQPPPTGIVAGPTEGSGAGSPARAGSRVLGAPPERHAGVDPSGGGGRPLGTFRNTYYDFPREADHAGGGKKVDKVALMNDACQPIAQVPRAFHDAVCVQGSGSLERGGTVSFAKRDCACAEVCPRTGQRICFDALDPKAFPWGRGAAGTAILPMRSLAADTAVLPLGTVVYIPEMVGAPRNESGTETVDGCFIVEDRGLKVKGEHVDIFTGHPGHTALMNERVPSNQGVTVVVDAPRCAHLKTAR